jgi:hypothetical protein
MAAAAAAAGGIDAAQYAEALRRQLIEGLGLDDLDDGDGDLAGGGDAAYGDLGGGGAAGGGAGAGSLRDLDRELDAFCGHEVIGDILDKGRVPKEYARDIDERLRGAELESIQDYIAESDNLVALHTQVGGCGWCEGDDLGKQ